MFFLGILSMIPSLYRSLLRVYGDYVNRINNRGLFSTVIGGAIIGLGMTLSGSVSTYNIQSPLYSNSWIFNHVVVSNFTIDSSGRSSAERT